MGYVIVSRAMMEFVTRTMLSSVRPCLLTELVSRMAGLLHEYVSGYCARISLDENQIVPSINWIYSLVSIGPTQKQTAIGYDGSCPPIVFSNLSPCLYISSDTVVVSLPGDQQTSTHIALYYRRDAVVSNNSRALACV